MVSGAGKRDGAWSQKGKMTSHISYMPREH